MTFFLDMIQIQKWNYVISDINECDSQPCLNGGTCEDEINAYYCRCTAEWIGVHCEGQSIKFRRVLREKPYLKHPKEVFLI